MEKAVGNYSFIGGVVLAVLLGVASPYFGAVAIAWMTSLLVFLGLLVGLLNVPDTEAKDLLLYVGVLVIAAGFGANGASFSFANVLYVGDILQGLFSSLLAFAVPATVVVCLKGILEITRQEG